MQSIVHADGGNMEISLIVAVARNGVIGDKGKLPWKLPLDMERFKQLTISSDPAKPHAVIMGRNTWESIPEKFRPLKDRHNIIVSSQLCSARANFPPQVSIVRTLTLALFRAFQLGAREAFVIGGAHLYREVLPKADKAYITLVDAEVEGDVKLTEVLPLSHEPNWSVCDLFRYESDAEHKYPFTFIEYAQKFS